MPVTTSGSVDWREYACWCSCPPKEAVKLIGRWCRWLFFLRHHIVDNRMALPLRYCPVKGGLRVVHPPPFGQQGTDRMICPGVRQTTSVRDAGGKMSEEFPVFLFSFLHQEDEALECCTQVRIIQEPRGPFGWYRYEAAVPLFTRRRGDDLVVEPEVMLPVLVVENCHAMEGWQGKRVKRKQIVVWLIEL